MSIFAPIARLFNSRAVSNDDYGYQLAGSGGTRTDSGVSVNDERALKVSAVWACTQLIANTVAGLPIKVFREEDDGSRNPIARKHYLTDLLHRRPNAMMKPRDFRTAMTVQMALWNNAYAEILWNADGDRPLALMPLRPGRMTPFIDKDVGLTYHYHVRDQRGQNSGIKVYAKKSILHLKGIGSDGIVAFDRSNYARETYGLSVSADTFAAKQFANGGRPGGVLELDKFLNAEQRDKVKQIYSGISEGAINANELWILEGGMKYQALDFGADQMQMIGTRLHQLSEVARYYGVPEIMIGAGSKGGSAWPASFEQQMLFFLTFTIQPYLDEWESAIRYSLIRATGSENVDHDVAPLVKMDSNAAAAYFSRLVQNGLMSRNESRVKLNLPKVSGEGMDDYTVQTNLIPIDDLEKVNADNQSDEPAGTVQPEIQQ